jgi:hypothetical protein
MAVQGTPNAPNQNYANWVLSPDDLRLFLRDYPESNTLLGESDFSDAELARSIRRAIEQANIIGRPTGYSVTSFPSAYILEHGAAAHLLKSEALRQLRNQATFQDGNVQPVGLDNKQGEYLQQASLFMQEFTQMVTTIKISENMNSFGQMSSPIRQAQHIR